MSRKFYKVCHDEVAQGFEDAAELAMQKAGRLEREAATARGDVVNGLPFITVVADGSWMKRSYRTGKYDSPSGVGVIVGYHTGKVLFIGVRNKYCVICARASNKGEEPREHVCFKNWDSNKSSTSMESDAILEGFKCSVEVHGLVYKHLIADGDSSVFQKIKDCHPYDDVNVVVKKIECRNHLYRNVCNKVKAVAATKGRIGAIRKVIEGSTLRFRTAVAKAVKHRQAQDVTEAVKRAELRKDILNIPSHIFGEHKECANRGYFCDGHRKVGEINHVPELVQRGLYEKLMDVVTQLTPHVESLLFDVDSNSVEQYNSIISKLIGGKRINFAQTNSYQARCAGAVVSYNLHAPLSRLSQVMEKTPNAVAKNVESKRRRRNLLRAERIRAEKERQQASGEPPARKAKRATPATADQDYGPTAQRPDMDPEVYTAQMEQHLKRLEEWRQEREAIERATLQQAESERWMLMRRKLLTASNFGRVCKMRPTTHSANTVKSLVYPRDLQLPALQYGRENEPKARRQIEATFGVKVDKCGLFIDSETAYFAATPDGLIDDDGIVEIKCPFSARELTPVEAIAGKVGMVHTIFAKNDHARMNEKHAYFYQVQGQLHITKRQYCIFALWTPLGMKTVRIQRNDQFWTEKMEPLLTRFYKNCMIPEIVDSRFSRGLPLREPEYILQARQDKANK
jgi:hypothetical protein